MAIKRPSREFESNLLCIVMAPYDIIPRMDWLTRHGAVIDFSTKIVTVSSGGKRVCKFQGHSDANKGKKLINVMTTYGLLRQVYVGYYCFLVAPKPDGGFCSQKFCCT